MGIFGNSESKPPEAPTIPTRPASPAPAEKERGGPAVAAFVAEKPDFVVEEPAFPFNEGVVTERVTYWPDAFVKRIA